MSGIETNQSLAHYIISFLLGDENLTKFVQYSDAENFSSGARIIIKDSGFFDDGIYGTQKTFPKVPFSFLPGTDIPFLFGEPKIKIDENGKIILFADLVASAYFLLSRYEEIIKPECRDKYERFLAKDSVVFQQGFGFRPLVDEWGRYLRNLLRESGIELPPEKHGFRKIYLTHDVDRPFFITSFTAAVKQEIKKILHIKNHIEKPLKSYFCNYGDPFYTFPWIIDQDLKVKSVYGDSVIEMIYFIITGNGKRHNLGNYRYFPITSFKYKNLLKFLSSAGAKFGLHVSHEGGIHPDEISIEINRLPRCVDNENLLSRHHFLRWQKPEDVEFMERAGIKEDFTLGYADSAGFRVGTCRPYHFINPRTKRITNIIEHPMQVMEGSLAAEYYMHLSFSDALNMCKKLLNVTYNFNGEVNILFHNSSFTKEQYYAQLYERMLHYIVELQ